MEKQSIQKIEHNISWTSLFRIVILAFSLYLIWQLTSVIMIVLLSLMLSAALYPAVKFLNKKLPLALSSVIIIMILFLPIIIIIVQIIPNLIIQLPYLLQTINNIVSSSPLTPESVKNIDWVQYSQLTGRYLLNSTSLIAGFITTFFSIIFLTLYIIIDVNRLSKMFYNLIPSHHEERVKKFINRLININGYYIRGNLFISLICGLVIGIACIILRIPFATSLAIFAGLLDLLPLIGALIGVIPAIIIAFAISPMTGLIMIIIYLIYQQFENQILAPVVYRKALELSPALSLLAVIVGASLFGITGAFIALPIAASLPTIISFVKEENNK